MLSLFWYVIIVYCNTNFPWKIWRLFIWVNFNFIALKNMYIKILFYPRIVFSHLYCFPSCPWTWYFLQSRWIGTSFSLFILVLLFFFWKKVFISPSVLKDNCAGYTVLDWWFLSHHLKYFTPLSLNKRKKKPLFNVQHSCHIWLWFCFFRLFKNVVSVS